MGGCAGCGMMGGGMMGGMNPMQQLLQQQQQQQMQLMQMQQQQQQQILMGAGAARGGAMNGATANEVEMYIGSNRLDDMAARALRAEPPHIQRAVMDRGPVTECVNPSSAIIGR